jgi:hypothetical protein
MMTQRNGKGLGCDSVLLIKAGVAQQCVGPISLEIAPRACTIQLILNKLLLLLLKPRHWLVRGSLKGKNQGTQFALRPFFEKNGSPFIQNAAL